MCAYAPMMGEAFPFPRPQDDPEPIDLLSAADFLLRDLPEIAHRSDCTWSGERSSGMPHLLHAAFVAAVLMDDVRE